MGHALESVIERRKANERETIAELRAYLQGVRSGVTVAAAAVAASTDEDALPHQVFEALTSRDFCYLGKGRVAAYRDDILTAVRDARERGRPIPFYYDIGGGYHASIRPGIATLCFDTGLAELLVLRQAADFSSRIARLYPPGARFSLVIDNLCAYFVNDIPLASTLGYCERLRQLICDVGLEAHVEVLVESEHVSLADFAVALGDTPGGVDIGTLTSKQHENVERFLGRPCETDEAAERTRRYQAVLDTSERLLAPLIRGIHMTQRASRDTICFRPFPGGDSRIQCGEVALTRNSRQRLCPVLLTSANYGDYAARRYQFPDILPSTVGYVTYAERLPD
jgi:hypothetical protein